MKRVFACTFSSLVLLAGCGGDGSYSGGNNNPPPPPPTGITITPNNAMQVAQVAYGSVVASADIASLAGDSGLTASSGGNFTKPAVVAKIGATLPSVILSDPIGPLTLPCAVSGSVTISGDLTNPLTLTAGDTILSDYDNCDDGQGEVIDGTLDFVVDAFAGDILAGLYDMTMTMDLIDFQTTTATDVLMGNGDGTATLDNTLAPYVEASVSGNAMTTDMNGVTETISAYASAQTFDGNLDPAPFTMTAAGTLDSSQLAGVVEYSTPLMFEGLGSDYPNTGELLIAGTDSSARLIVQNNIDVHIQIDADGDGTVDETIMTTWAELESM